LIVRLYRRLSDGLSVYYWLTREGTEVFPRLEDIQFVSVKRGYFSWGVKHRIVWEELEVQTNKEWNTYGDPFEIEGVEVYVDLV
jgi:hypothetical protein